MSEFRERIERPLLVEEKHEPAPAQPAEREDPDKVTPTPEHALDPEQRKLEIWEGEHKRKYAIEYFEIPNLADEFSIKMEIGKIDKYIKNELEKRGYEKNIENYAQILRELEQEIGSSRLELYKRLKKISGAMDIETKISRLKEMRGLLRNV